MGKICCVEFHRDAFEIPNKISYPNTERYDFEILFLFFFFNFMKLQFYELLVLRAHKCFSNAPHQWASLHDDVIKWKHFPHYWPLVWGIHRSLVNSPHKGQWHGALMFSFICTWINAHVNNREAGDLRHHCVHYDIIVMLVNFLPKYSQLMHMGHIYWWFKTHWALVTP